MTDQLHAWLRTVLMVASMLGSLITAWQHLEARLVLVESQHKDMLDRLGRIEAVLIDGRHR